MLICRYWVKYVYFSKAVSFKIDLALKSICENSGYKIYSKQKVLIKDGFKERETVYYFEKCV